MKNTLYYGDNLPILRDHVADESVDLVYLDPPFNSARDGSVLFKQAKKDENQAQITAFTDTWQWSKGRYEEFFDDPRNARLFGQCLTRGSDRWYILEERCALLR